jgi:DNA polymerase (family 10)
VADLLEIQGANVFRVRAYRNAARTVETLGTPVESMLSSGGNLEELPGVGKDLAGKIREIVETGELGMLRELAKELPEGLVLMMRIPGVGPKRAKQVYDSLGIATLDDLEAAARAGKLRELRGLGPTIEAKILQGITEQRAHAGRHPLAEAEAYVKPHLEHLRGVPGLTQIEVAGSFRRRRETVGDIDVLVAAEKPEDVTESFVTYSQVKEVTARGDTRSAVVLRSGLQVDLRVVPERSFGAALHYFTGSKPHNIAIRTLGVKRKLKINEYGVFRGAKSIGGRTEEEVFKAVGLPWIPPELREDRGEIDAARENRLKPSPDEIRGDPDAHDLHRRPGVGGGDGRGVPGVGLSVHRDHGPYKGRARGRRPRPHRVPQAVPRDRQGPEGPEQADDPEERRS